MYLDAQLTNFVAKCVLCAHKYSIQQTSRQISLKNIHSIVCYTIQEDDRTILH